MSEGIIRVVLATRRPFPIYPSRPTCGRSLDFVGMGQDLAHDPQQTTFVIRSPRRRGQATWVAPSGPAPLRRDFECSVPISDIRFNRRVSVEVWKTSRGQDSGACVHDRDRAVGADRDVQPRGLSRGPARCRRVDAAEKDLQHPLVALGRAVSAVSRSAVSDRGRFHGVADLNVAAILS